MKDLYSRLKKHMLLPIMIVILFATALIFDDFGTMFEGYLDILKSPSVLISDYLYIGGLGATLFNVATIMLLNIVLIIVLKLKMTGPVFAGLFTIAGFSFFGKNIFNTIPIYIGIYLYARYRRIDYKTLITVILFSTGISPIVSFLIFGTGWELYYGIPSGIIIGIVSGFVLPAISANTFKFHQGFNLYNVGFAMGILSMLYAAILRSFDINLDLGGPSSDAFHLPLLIMTLVLSASFVIGALIGDRKVFLKYPKLIKSTGQLVSDFVGEYGKEVTMLNVGIMGFLSAGIIVILGFKINGALMGAILTIMGFGAFGKHPKNSLPVMIGAYLGVILTKYSFDSVGIMIALFFVTALAPVAGKYGFAVGILAGFLHIIITPLSYAFQGGFDLYNNGFAAGFVAAILVPILDALKGHKVVTPPHNPQNQGVQP
jgi:hypothetical protein